MPKFSATSAHAFRTQAAIDGRKARGCPFVVIVEADDGSWCELDGDSEAHAVALASNWVDVGDARGASCWRVLPDGRLARQSVFHLWAAM